MSHLTTQQLIDVADALEPEGSLPHLQSCATCREQVLELRETLEIVGEVTVPAPSPLFWDRLSERVHDAVERERHSDSSAAVSGLFHGRNVAEWLRSRTVWMAAVGAAAVLVAAVSLTRVEKALAPSPGLLSRAVTEATNDVAAVAEDSSLSLVADLAGDLDWDSAREAGLTTHVGVDDDAVNQLTEDERRELRQLLQGELLPTRRGA
jgi:hypothetical protein